MLADTHLALLSRIVDPTDMHLTKLRELIEELLGAVAECDDESYLPSIAYDIADEFGSLDTALGNRK